MKCSPKRLNEAVGDVITYLLRDGMTFREVADAARFAVLNAVVDSRGRELRLPTSGSWIAELQSDAEASKKLSWLLLRQPFIGKRSLFMCYRWTHFCASVRYYQEETDPASDTHGDEEAALEQARVDDAELLQFVEGLLLR